MKKNILPLLLVFVLTACVRPVATLEATEALIDPLDVFKPSPSVTNIVLETQETDSGSGNETDAVIPTSEIVTPTESPTIAPTTTPAPTETPEDTATPEPTEITDLFSPPEGVPIDPMFAFGNSRFTDTFKDATMWQNYYGDSENEYILLDIEEDKLSVTGKQQDLITWWFDGFDLVNFYIQMTVDSGECSETDAYGLILRGASHGEPSHGYIIAFTCDGQIFARRVDSANPYKDQQLLGYTQSTIIHTGSNQTNVLGVLMEDDEISIYANGYFFTTLLDPTFKYGRYGVFVMAGPTENYTYSTSEIKIWERPE